MNDKWAHLPPAGPKDWEPCPRCYNMDGGCPFCGHGMVPKVGFRWPMASDRAAPDTTQEPAPRRCAQRSADGTGRCTLTPRHRGEHVFAEDPPTKHRPYPSHGEVYDSRVDWPERHRGDGPI